VMRPHRLDRTDAVCSSIADLTESALGKIMALLDRWRVPWYVKLVPVMCIIGPIIQLLFLIGLAALVVNALAHDDGC